MKETQQSRVVIGEEKDIVCLPAEAGSSTHIIIQYY